MFINLLLYDIINYDYQFSLQLEKGDFLEEKWTDILNTSGYVKIIIYIFMVPCF